MWFCVSPPRLYACTMPLTRSAFIGVSAWRGGARASFTTSRQARIFGSDILSRSGQYLGTHVIKQIASSCKSCLFQIPRVALAVALSALYLINMPKTSFCYVRDSLYAAVFDSFKPNHSVTQEHDGDVHRWQLMENVWVASIQLLLMSFMGFSFE